MAVALPEPLETAIKNGKCVLFVGSGLSAAAGYPSWEKLINILVEEAKKLPHARIKGIEEFESAKDYFTLAEFARSALGRNQYTSILRKELGKPATPTETHKAIAERSIGASSPRTTIGCSKRYSHRCVAGRPMISPLTRYRLWVVPCITRNCSYSNFMAASLLPNPLFLRGVITTA